MENKKKKKDKEVINPLEKEVDKLNKELETIKKENEALKVEVDKLKNDYSMAYADTENTRKRLNAEAELERKYRIQSFAKEVLPAIDNLERALAQDTANEEALGYKKGVEMIYAQLIKALSDEGVEMVDVLDKPYDPNNAQAIMVEKRDGYESGIVIEVLQKGYRLKDRILRPAMVKVSE